MEINDIIKDENLTNKIKNGINKLSDAVLQTYGPFGRTVGIYNEYGEPYVTKDGVSVANYIELKDSTENFGITLLKEVAQKTVNLAGDGTTTSICLAQSIINKGYKLLEKGYSYNDLKSNLEKLENKSVEWLKKFSNHLDKNGIYNVANISSNNDSNIANLIKEAYGHSNIVKVYESDKLEDSLETINGMKLNGSYFNKAFINNEKKQSIEYNNVILLIIKGRLDKLDKVSDFLLKNTNKNIIIMADYFSDDVLSLCKLNFNKHGLNIGLVKSPGFAQHRKDLISDIINYTKAYHSLNDYYIAKLDSLVATHDSLIISKKEVDVNDLLTNLKNALLNSDNKGAKDLLTKRINNLEGNLSIIKVGGISELEIRERKDRIDDAVLAVKCALEEGVVIGAGIALKEISDLFNDNLFSECLKLPYYTIENSLPDNYIINQSIVIDPTKVIRIALQNAISVSKTLLSMNALVIK